jgi:hypothetical protein
VQDHDIPIAIGLEVDLSAVANLKLLMTQAQADWRVVGSSGERGEGCES